MVAYFSKMIGFVYVEANKLFKLTIGSIPLLFNIEDYSMYCNYYNSLAA